MLHCFPLTIVMRILVLGIRSVPERSHPSEDTTLLRNRRGRLRIRDVQTISPSVSVSQASASADSADGSSSSGSETGDPVSPVAADEVDPSIVAIRFGADSTGFELCQCNQIVLSESQIDDFAHLWIACQQARSTVSSSGLKGRSSVLLGAKP